MPRLTVWAIRTALLYLLVGFTFGALMLSNKGLGFYPPLWRLLPAHIEFLLLGWTGQLALGIGFWILPRFRLSRGRTGLAWLAYGLLNLGILLEVGGQVLGGPAGVVLAGRLAEAGAALSFLAHAWPRAKPPGLP